MNRDERLRNCRLVFYEKDIDGLHAELDSFLELSGARCALIVDREGHLVTQRGETLKGSHDAISALIAGSFAATREMARLLGEDQFTIMFHQGSRDSIQLQLVGDRALLAVLFDQRTNLGMVRFYAQETGKKVGAMIESIAAEARTANLSDDFSDSAAAALDKLF
jgi:predicted regulator of Ras-like GTPase activity (Roadblock/LC7/MglB family)